jgi:hypothetical protein
MGDAQRLEMGEKWPIFLPFNDFFIGGKSGQYFDYLRARQTQLLQ